MLDHPLNAESGPLPSKAVSTSRIADHVGRVLGGRYRLIAPVGTGASAHVFVSDDVTLRRRVAVKVLHPALAEDDSFLRRFRAEAHAAAALNHPNIMRVYDWGEDADGPYLVLEYLGGGSVRDLLDAGRRLSQSQALVVGIEAARALDHAHRRGLVHRDIKPANLLFDDEGRLCIADFGLARALAEAAWTEPSGTIVGTARYAAPEQAKGGALDGRADVYSLALVLIEAVTGEVPFTADTTVGTLMARAEQSITAPEALGPLGPIVEQAGAVDPADRIDAARMVRLLAEAAPLLPSPAPLPLVGSLPLDATRPIDPNLDRTELPPPSSKTRLFDRAEVVDDDPTGDEEIEPIVFAPAARRRRRWWPFVVVPLVLLALAAGVAYAIDAVAVPTHPVPSLRGRTLSDARAAVRRSDFEVQQTREVFDDNLGAGVIVQQEPLPGRRLREGSTIKVFVSKGAQPRAVPDLAGVDQAEAVRRLEAAGFRPKIEAKASEDVPKDRVLEWSPQGVHGKDTEVTVVVSSGPAPRSVPDVSERTYDEAAAALDRIGLVAVRTDVFSDTVPAGKVVSTSPGTGASVARGSKVTVRVSKGPELVAVPDVRGKSPVEASAALRAVGLDVSGTVGPPDRPVANTRPAAGEKVKKGTQVTLYTR